MRNTTSSTHKQICAEKMSYQNTGDVAQNSLTMPKYIPSSLRGMIPNLDEPLVCMTALLLDKGNGHMFTNCPAAAAAASLLLKYLTPTDYAWLTLSNRRPDNAEDIREQLSFIASKAGSDQVLAMLNPDTSFFQFADTDEDMVGENDYGSYMTWSSDDSDYHDMLPHSQCKEAESVHENTHNRMRFHPWSVEISL